MVDMAANRSPEQTVVIAPMTEYQGQATSARKWTHKRTIIPVNIPARPAS